jgi:hypothetical protein
MKKMDSFKIFIIATCIGLAAMITQAFSGIRDKEACERYRTPGSGFAVVELFTSEGCSSCPPADAVVAKLEKESSDKPIYILAYHVDYWNRLGWKDVFSSSEYSDRQRQYARWLKLSSIYTPQVIVNGRTELVGSEEGNLHSAINAGLQKTSKEQLTLDNIKITGDKVSLQYHSSGAPNNTALLIALVEKRAATKVKAGENGGRMLSHVQIVRNLQSKPLRDKNGTESIVLPHGLDQQNWEVIGFIQNTLNGEITAAAKASAAK